MIMNIERPWEKSFCDKCTHCFQEDMCSAYNLGMSYAYCPQVIDCNKFESKIKTNADRIRAMSDEDLAEFLSDDDRACPPKWHNCRKHISECGGCWLEWLKQPAEGDQ
jgi:hypothetical protein